MEAVPAKCIVLPAAEHSVNCLPLWLLLTHKEVCSHSSLTPAYSQLELSPYTHLPSLSKCSDLGG